MKPRHTQANLCSGTLLTSFTMQPTLRQAVLAVSLAVLPLASSHAATGNWTYTGTTAANLSWAYSSASTPSWQLNTIPNAIGDIANFTFNITAAKTITLDGDKTVGTLSIDDIGTTGFFAYTLSAGIPTTSRLILDAASGNAAINSDTAVNTVTNVINVPITFNDPLVITNSKTNVAGTLNLNGAITAGTASLGITKLGNGAVLLAAANSYDGGTTITAGKLGASNATSFGSGLVSVANGGQAWLASGISYANAFNIAGSGYSNGADAAAATGAMRYGGATTTGTINLTAAARIGAYNGASGTLAGPLTGSAALEINSSGASQNGNLVLTGNAAGFTGLVTVSQGTLRLGPSSNLGGSLEIKDGANLYAEGVGASGSATVGTAAGATRSLTLGNPSSTTTGATLYVDPSTTDALQVIGDVTLNGTTTVALTGGIASGPITILNYSGNLTGSAANLTLAGGMSGYRNTPVFNVGGGKITLNLVAGALKWTGALNQAWNTTDANWDNSGSMDVFYPLDNVTFDDTAATKAVYTTNLTAATNNDLVFTAVASGPVGEAVTITYVDPSVANALLSVDVSGNAITVSLATNETKAIISTATKVMEAIQNKPEANALVSVANAASNDGSGVVATLATTTLALPNPAITIATGVTVAPGSMTFNHSAIDYSITGSGAIEGGGSLIKSGTGMLTLATPNTFTGGVTLTSGRLRVGQGLALGTGAITITGGQFSEADTSTRTMANGAIMSGSFILGDATDNGGITLNGASTLAGNTTIDMPSTSTHTFGGVITDGASSFSLTKRGSSSVLALSGANTYDGGTVIDSGKINASNATSFGTGPVTVFNGSQANLAGAGPFANAFTLAGIGITETTGSHGALLLTGATATGPITLAAGTRITAYGSTGTLSGIIGETAGPQALELSNYNTTTDSTITVSGDNTYSGGTTVKGATVIANHNNAFGTGPVTLQSNGTVARVTRVQLGKNVELPAANNFVLDSDAATTTSAITSYAGDTTTASTAIVYGPVEILKKVGGGGHLASTKGSASVLRVMGAVTSPNGVSVVVRQGTVELGGGGDYAAIEVVDGLLKLAANGGLCATSTLSIGTSGTTGETGTFDLNGFNQSLVGLLKGAQPATVTNNGAGPSTLTLNLASSATYAGTFVDGSGVLELRKTGAGTLTLSGISSLFTDTLLVTDGGLNLTAPFGGVGSIATMSTGTTLSGESTFGGNLTLNGATLNVDGSTAASLTATGDVNSVAGVLVNLQSVPTIAGPIKIVGFGTTLTGSADNFSLVNSSAYRSPVFSIAANAVNLTLGTPVALTWTGTGGSVWDVNTSSNWNNPALTPSTFMYADNVTFGNTGGGTIGVPASVIASNLVINSNDNWLFQGAGTVAAAAVTKDGSGTATFENPVNFYGTVALTAGNLRLSPPSGVTNSVAGVISGAGTLVKGGDGSLTVSGANAGFTGSTVISKGDLGVGSSNALGTSSIIFGDANTTASDICKLTIGTGLTLANTPLTVTDTCLNAWIYGPGAISGTAITMNSTGTLRVGNTLATATTGVITGTSSILVRKGILKCTSKKPLGTTTTVTLGDATSGSANSVLELPAATTNDEDILQCPIVVGANSDPNSKAIIRTTGASNACSSTSPITLNRDLWVENTGSVIVALSGKITGTGNLHVDVGSSAKRLRLRYYSGTTLGSDYVGDIYLHSGMIQFWGGTNTSATSYNVIPDRTKVIMSAGTIFGVASSEVIGALVGGAADAPNSLGQAVATTNLGTTATPTLTLGGGDQSGVFDGIIAEEGSGKLLAIVKTGTGTQTLNGASTFTGVNTTHTAAFTLLGGTVALGNDAALSTGAVNLKGNLAGTIRSADATPRTLANAIIYSTDTTLGSPTTGNLLFTGTVNVGGAAKAFNVQNAITEFSGVISGSGILIRSKSGPGTLIFSGNNTYTGTTAVNEGKLLINNTAGSGTGTTNVTVAAGATLGGSGSISGAVSTSAATAIIAPGNSTGILTVGSADLSLGGSLEIQINDAATPKTDKLLVTGNLNVSGATLNVTSSGTPTQPVYVIASYATLTGTFGSITKPSNYDLVYNYNDGVSSHNIALVQQADPYAGWLAAYPALTGANRAPGVDFDNDGLDNGVEFVIGSDPTTATAADRPKATVTGGNLEFTFKRSDVSESYAVTVEVGTDLANWPASHAIPPDTAVGPIVYVTDNGPTTADDVTVKVPMAPDAKKFARIKAEIPFTP